MFDPKSQLMCVDFSLLTSRIANNKDIFSANIMSSLIATLKRQDYFVTARVAGALAVFAKDGT